MTDLGMDEDEIRDYNLVDELLEKRKTTPKSEAQKLDEFHYALLTATLFMSQVPCDSSYDRKMAELLGEVKKAHDNQIAQLKAHTTKEEL